MNMRAKPIGDVTGFVSEWVQEYGHDPVNLLQILVRIQENYGYVPDAAADLTAQGLGIPRMQVDGVTEFYFFLQSAPRGTYHILLSDSITDHMLGKQELMQYFCEKLGVKPAETRADGRVTVDNTSCTGMCDQGPATVVNGFALTRLSRARIDRLVELIDNEVSLSEWPREFFEVNDNIHRADLLLAQDFVAGSALEAVHRRGADTILEELGRSGLRGLGGAGFKTAAKWALCREAPSDERFVVCNADEGEPGTFKDRVILQRYPDLLFEGMTLCARVIGARKGFLYLRGEYRYMLEMLQDVLEHRRQAGLLGERIAGAADFAFDIEIHLGAGAYICGEESSLIESLEGKRGVARVRPPYPVTHGYLGKPTVVNNVETFAAAAKIAVRGGDWYAQVGTGKSPGTKILSISGDCQRPGLYEYPFGVTVRQILQDCGATNTQAVQVAGAAGHCIGEDEFDRKIAYEDLATGGSFMVFNKDRDMLDMARNFVRFFAHESCGFCTPCRVGSALMKDLMEKVYTGHGTPMDLDEMRNLGLLMQKTSQCGLGATAPSALFDTLDKFPQVYERRLKATTFEPAFDLDGALEAARQITGRDDAGAHL